jgi:hypothetical protein
MEMTTMTLKVQYLTKLEDGTQIQAGWYVTTPFCPEVFATEQEALAYGRTEECRVSPLNLRIHAGTHAIFCRRPRASKSGPCLRA